LGDNKWNRGVGRLQWGVAPDILEIQRQVVQISVEDDAEEEVLEQDGCHGDVFEKIHYAVLVTLFAIAVTIPPLKQIYLLGIIGNVDTFHSTNMKMMKKIPPTTSMEMTMGLIQVSATDRRYTQWPEPSGLP
jgi:hypothetical protein